LFWLHKIGKNTKSCTNP